MADFTALKTAIQTYIKQNGNEEITGDILQEVLLSMVQTMGDGAINELVNGLASEVTNRQNADGILQGNINTLGGRIDGVVSSITEINTKLAEGYLYSGIATPLTDPGTPIVKTFYIATAAGTYTNFGGLTVVQGITILKYNGSTWSQEIVYLGDDNIKNGMIQHPVELESVQTYSSQAIDGSGNLVSGVGDTIKYNVKPKALYSVDNIYTPQSNDRLGYAIYDVNGNFLEGGKTNGNTTYIYVTNPAASYILCYQRYASTPILLSEDVNYRCPLITRLSGNSSIRDYKYNILVTIDVISVNYNGKLESYTVNDSFSLIRNFLYSYALVFNIDTGLARVVNFNIDDISYNDVILILLSSTGEVVGGELYDQFQSTVNDDAIRYIKSQNVISLGAIIPVNSTIGSSSLKFNGDIKSASSAAYVNEYLLTTPQVAMYVDARVPALSQENRVAVQFWHDNNYLGYALLGETNARNAIHELIFIPEGCNRVLVAGNTGNVEANLYEHNKTILGGNSLWYGKKCVWIGDSLSWGSSISDHTRAYPYLVCQKLGINLVNYSIGGSIIAKGADNQYMVQQGGQNYDEVYLDYSAWQAAVQAGTLDTTKKYLVQDGARETVRPYGIYHYEIGSWVKYGDTSDLCGRTPIVDCVKAMDTDADLIVVAGGTNDFYYEWSDFGTMASRDKTSFYGALHQICQYLVETYTNKQIVFINIIKRWQQQIWMCKYPEDANAFGKTIDDYNTAIKEVCSYYSIPVIDLYSISGMNPAFDQSVFVEQASTFYVHPNYAGHERIASFVEAFLANIRF